MASEKKKWKITYEVPPMRGFFNEEIMAFTSVEARGILIQQKKRQTDKDLSSGRTFCWKRRDSLMEFDIYEQGRRLGLDKPLTDEERKEIEQLMHQHNKHSLIHRTLLRLLCAEKAANSKDDEEEVVPRPPRRNEQTVEVKVTYAGRLPVGPERDY